MKRLFWRFRFTWYGQTRTWWGWRLWWDWSGGSLDDCYEYTPELCALECIYDAGW